MQPSLVTSNKNALVMWQPIVAGILCVWKKAQIQFSVFQSIPPHTRDITTNVQLVKGVTNTLQESLSRANMDIVVYVNTEVVSVEDCASPKAIALYKAQTEDIDRMIAAIQATEESYKLGSVDIVTDDLDTYM